MISIKDLTAYIKQIGLVNKSVCVHSSLKSFGEEIKGGADTVIKAFIDSGCTIIAPAFSYRFLVKPPENMRPGQNGYEYSNPLPESGLQEVFSTDSNEISKDDMGALPAALLETQGRIRGNHPICSFAGIGPYAAEIIKTQAPGDVFAPLRELALFNGFVLMMGTGLTTLTALHLSEQMAGRNMFVRWAKDAGGKVITCECGGCSEGFGALEPYLGGMDKKVTAGKSLWRSVPISALLKKTARIIMLEPGITRCKEPVCMRCEDAIKGGPAV